MKLYDSHYDFQTGKCYSEEVGETITYKEKWTELWAMVYDYSALQHCKKDVAMQRYDYSYREGFNDALDWVINRMNIMDGEEDQQKL